MIMPLTGTVSMLATTETTGRPPKRGISTGATPIWAARVMPSTSRHTRGPHIHGVSLRPSRAIPADAATESWKPTDHTSSGSNSTSVATASARARAVEVGRPASTAVTAMAAIAEARSTEGSKRVTRPNAPMAPRVAPQRATDPNRLVSGDASTSTKATF
jgi:hypothetical protein